jgi:DNA-binding GntR family transcriptional regulator
MKNIKNKGVIPLYSRIAYSLRHKILSGQLEPGSKISSEDQLAEFYGVSRITIRMALSHLEEENLISRNRGKGTFVSQSVPIHHSTIYKSVRDFSLKTQRSTIKPLSIKNVKVGETRIAHDIRSFFNLSNEDEIAQIQRILMVDGAPRAFFENFMRPELASFITEKEIFKKKAIVRILKDKTQLTLGKGEAYLQALPLDPDIAHSLGRQVFDTFIRTQVFLWQANGEPFEIANYFMPAEHFKYKLDIDATGFD